jgi:hypothetical protein
MKMLKDLWVWHTVRVGTWNPLKAQLVYIKWQNERDCCDFGGVHNPLSGWFHSKLITYLLRELLLECFTQFHIISIFLRFGHLRMIVDYFLRGKGSNNATILLKSQVFCV